MARNRENETSTRPRRKTDTGTDTVPVKQTGTETGTGTGHRNTQVGVVVKAKMTKTVVVAVERLVQHALYRKTLKLTSTFIAHDRKGGKQGGPVRIVGSRPPSPHKRVGVAESLTPVLAEDVARG